MKRRNKLTLGIVGLAAAALFVSGCTANFCTNKEKSRIAYAFEPGVSEFVVEGEFDETDVVYNEVYNGKIHQIVRASKDENGNITSYKNSTLLNEITSSAKSSSVAVPSG